MWRRPLGVKCAMMRRDPLQCRALPRVDTIGLLLVGDVRVAGHEWSSVAVLIFVRGNRLVSNRDRCRYRNSRESDLASCCPRPFLGILQCRPSGGLRPPTSTSRPQIALAAVLVRRVVVHWCATHTTHVDSTMGHKVPLRRPLPLLLLLPAIADGLAARAITGPWPKAFPAKECVPSVSNARLRCCVLCEPLLQRSDHASSASAPTVVSAVRRWVSPQ